MTATEAARVTGLSSATIRAACRQGRLPATLAGKTWVFEPAALTAWLAKRAETSPAGRRGRPLKSPARGG